MNRPTVEAAFSARKGNGLADLANCDVNGDGIPDILAADGFAWPDTLIGKGDGTFTTVTIPLGVDFEASSVTCGTFTPNIRYGQIAMASTYDSGVEILTGSRSGQMNLLPVGWSTDLGPTQILSGKFHGDSAVDDLVVLDSTNGTISILINAAQ